MKNLSSEEILKIPISAPEMLFSGNLNTAKEEYRKLSRKWHPDVNKEVIAEDVFVHIYKLYEETKRLIGEGRWAGGGVLIFKTKTNILKIVYNKVKQFELGSCYIGRNHIVYIVKKDFIDFFRNAKFILSNLTYANKEMKKKVGRFLPNDVQYIYTKDSAVMIIPKTEDIISLKDLLFHFNGKIDKIHVAWILNSLYNICCYLNYKKLVHLNIDIDTCFVSPKYHAIYLFGGWWYSTNAGKTITTVPVRTSETLSLDILREKKAKTLIDLDMVRFLGRELLGDRTGEHLKYDKDVPLPIIRWLRSSTTEDAILDYKLWKDVLEKCFGKPKFIKMDLDINLFY